ncbi:HAD hydrolase-like protein [Pseudorhodoplanes sinuspersici]|uniref:HAD family hydrolase n=1 Tax=Pseudorhodoplanes sinuspersici TaxID=1235591 RepID=A0A1W6ZW12_9HYPH|nr:HAD hydrolase-like protein [Pseudorhodoplanes sinuspersici]ARQ01500.1 HAD family hydrolase [Pseudorhodoplanes sinuspersici]RKE73200.1 phosphoglycolate phosphatase [Pseudorhodoplanes sinuspersici]
MPKYKLAIFDLDGTLADSFPWFLRVVNDVAREFDFKPIDAGEIDALRRKGSREILKSLDVPLWKLPMIASRMRGLKRSHLQNIPLFAGVPAMLKALKEAGTLLALVSSDNEANARLQLGPDHALLFNHFDCGASLFGKAAKFSRVMKRAGVPPQQTIAIGDEARDCEAARAAGIAFGAVTWGYADPDILRSLNPDEIFSTVDDITITLVGKKNNPRATTFA